MYNDGMTPREEANEHFILPIAKRQVLFDKTDFLRESHDIDKFSQEIRDKLCLPYVSHLFTRRGGTEFYEEDPMVRWYVEETVFNEGENNLNGFVHSVTVSAVRGNRMEFDSHVAKVNKTVHEIVEYITNPWGVSTEIYWHPLYEFLLRKPELTVTNEGVLLFYTEDCIIATLDCNCGHVMCASEFKSSLKNENITGIEEITVAEDGSNVIKFKTCDNQEAKHKLSVKFDFFSDIKVVIKID